MDNNKFDLVGFIMSFEGGELSNDEIIEGFQHLIDTGMVWSLQGSYGRMAKRLIEEGYCHENNKHQFTPFKGRMVVVMQEVEVYRNLHRNCWSIRDAKTKLVLGYADNVTLSDAHFVVNESGRQRVLKEQKKNVHAFVRGRILFTDVPCTGTKVAYNPYKFKSFVTVHEDHFLDIHHAMNVTLTQEMEVYV